MEEREPQGQEDEVVLPDDAELEDLTASDEADDVRGGVRKAGKGQQDF